MNTAGRLVGGLMLLGVSVVSGLLTYGTYWHLTSKKKWSGWKAGAAIGAVTGGLALALSVAGVYPGLQGIGALPSRRSAGYNRLMSSRRRMAGQFGALVVDRLTGCSACR